MVYRLAAIIACLLTPTVVLAEPRVVASILPLQSLAAAVMNGVGEPALLLPAGASPHAYSLKPSDAELLESADVVLWVGDDLERFMVGPLESLAAGARTVAMVGVEGVTLLPFREGGVWDEHVHPAGDVAHAGDDHDHDHAHDHDAVDMHLWLAPDNAKAMIRAIADALAAVDPANTARYVANAEATIDGLAALQIELAHVLAPVQDVPFVVFHDAYQYFDRAFGLRAVGSVTVSPEIQPGTAQVARLRQRIEDDGAVCVFAEPQFEPRLVTMLIDGTAARAGVLDPVGADLAPGSEAYPQLMRDLAASLVDCLGDG